MGTILFASLLTSSHYQKHRCTFCAIEVHLAFCNAASPPDPKDASSIDPDTRIPSSAVLWLHTREAIIKLFSPHMFNAKSLTLKPLRSYTGRQSNCHSSDLRDPTI
jgi:hypothetical protein